MQKVFRFSGNLAAAPLPTNFPAPVDCLGISFAMHCSGFVVVLMRDGVQVASLDMCDPRCHQCIFLHQCVRLVGRADEHRC
jgi:hypothetical protein